MFRFDSDVNLANPSTTSGQAFTEFAGSQCEYSVLSIPIDRFLMLPSPAIWAEAFQAAAYKLSVLGVSGETAQGFTDCTGILG